MGMADFFQTGHIATLHRLGQPNIRGLTEQLENFSLETPMALVLPCHIREVGTQALNGILRVLKTVTYIKQIIVGIDGAIRSSEWNKARRFFRQLPQRPMLLWNDGPRMKALFGKLEDAEISPGPGGKGRNVWICFGYLLASEQAGMVAVHDCDILTYDHELLARLW